MDLLMLPDPPRLLPEFLTSENLSTSMRSLFPAAARISHYQNESYSGIPAFAGMKHTFIVPSLF